MPSELSGFLPPHLKRFVFPLVCGAMAVVPAERPRTAYRPTTVGLQLIDIEKRTGELGRRIARLRSLQIDDRLLAGVEIFYKTLEWQLRYLEEIYRRH